MPSAGSQVRAWCFTVHLPTIDDAITFKPYEQWEGVSYIVYQLECCPDTKRLHYQGYVLWNRKKTLAYCKKQHNTAHWEPRRGTHEQARDYCKKQESRVMDYVFEYGDEPKPGQRNDLLELKKSIDEGKTQIEVWDQHFPVMVKYHRAAQVYSNLKIAKRNFKTEVAVLYGPTGTGKTRWIHDNLDQDKTYWLTSARSNGDPWMDGYDPIVHEAVVIDEFYGWIRLDTLLRMLDRYPYHVETKGGMVEFKPKLIYLTSNKSPAEWYSKLVEKGTSLDPMFRRINLIWRFTGPNTWVVEKEDFEDEE